MDKETNNHDVPSQIKTRLSELRDLLNFTINSFEEQMLIGPKKIADIQKEISDWEKALEATTPLPKEKIL